jgi:hypothetical protein
LEEFNGPLERLLTLARTQQIDPAGLAKLVDQLAAAIQQAHRGTWLSQMGDWVVMAAWLLLRSRLLLPADAPPARAWSRCRRCRRSPPDSTAGRSGGAPAAAGVARDSDRAGLRGRRHRVPVGELGAVRRR